MIKIHTLACISFSLFRCFPCVHLDGDISLLLLALQNITPKSLLLSHHRKISLRFNSVYISTTNSKLLRLFPSKTMAAGVKAHKRARSESDECVFSHRSKCFINQQIIDQNDANKMKKIHGELSFITKLAERITTFNACCRQNHKNAFQKCQQKGEKYYRRTDGSISQ